MKQFYPEKILIDERVLKLEMTQEILERLKPISFEVIPPLYESLPSLMHETHKKYLILAKQDGKFLKPCPCTPKHITCGYYFLNIGTNCNVECSYCFILI